MNIRAFALAGVWAGALLSAYPVEAKNITRYPRHRPNFSANIVGVFGGVYKDLLPLETQLGLDPSFNEQQQELIQEAMKIFMKRALKKDVVFCAFSHASKDLPESQVKFTAQLLSALTMLQREHASFPAFVFIGRYWDDPKSVGLAYLDLFYDRDFPFPGFDHRHYLHVALNSDFLGDGSSYRYSNDVNYWAGVLAHEFLHNLGYNHPTGYERSFIREYQMCVMNDALEAAPLEDEAFDTVVEKEVELDL